MKQEKDENLMDKIISLCKRRAAQFLGEPRHRVISENMFLI